ncbi:MAG: M28 family peptidase [Bacteroidota bacterium]
MKKYIFLLLIASVAVGQGKFDKNATKGLESITTNDLKSHLMFLASDELEGRETTFRGQKVAAQYIASVFRKLGLKPAGDDNSYFQQFKLDVVRPSSASSLRLTSSEGSTNYAFGKDFITTTAKDTAFSAPLVFAGFMDTPLTPEQETGLMDRVVVVFAGRRSDVLNPTPSVARRGGFRVFRNAAAVILISDEATHGSVESQAKALANSLQKGSMSVQGSPRRGRGQISLTVSPAVGVSLLAELGMPLPELRIKAAKDSVSGPRALTKASLAIDLKAHHEVKTSENVAAILEGSDPVLKNEYVILTAHYDHVGVSASTGEIYNGADDDGSGTSMILELAEAFVANPTKPKRSMVFMTVTGEEKGLLGSAYYVQNPLLPLERTTTNLNIDMIGRIDKKHEEAQSAPYVYVIGSDKISTELDSVLVSANKQTARLLLDYEFNDDNDPNQFYRRSDHYNFARNGIPIIFFFTGIHDDYHRPTDVVEKIEFERMVKIGQLIYATAWKAGNFKRPFVKNGKPSAYSSER